MVAIVTGNALGLSLGSLATLGQRGASGSSTTGRNGEQAYVNAVTGNLVLQDRDELLVGRGLTAESLRTYNSRGLMTDDNGDNWSLGVYAQQLRLGAEGTYAQPGSVFIRTDRDGAQSTYTWDAVKYRYVSTDGGGAHDTIHRGEDDNWVWTDGSTRREEHYSWSSGRLVQAIEPNGAFLRYDYDGARLVRVTTSGGETTHYDYEGDLLQQIRTVTDEQGSPRTTTRVRYGYDELRRLESVTVDLTPLDTTDQATYRTEYAYEGDSKRIARVTQTDGTSLTFTYDGMTRVKTVTDALNNTTNFNYLSGGRTEVAGPMGLKTWYDHDPSGRLLRVTSLSGTKTLEVTSFGYNAAGDLIQTIDGAGRPVMFGYDERGNQTSQVDFSYNAISRTFNAHNQLLTETLYTGLDPDISGPAKPTGAMTTRYVYDAAGKNRLRFVLTPEGRVTEYIYDAQGQRTGMLVYTAAIYPVADLDATAVPTEAQLESWGFAQRTTRQLVRTDMAYDARGQLSSSTVFNAVSAVGEGVFDGQQSVTQYVYDQQGLLRQTIAPGARTTAHAYDGLGRLIASTDGNNVTTLTIHDDALNQTSIRYDNGLTTVSSYDRAGRLAFVQQVAGVVLGTTTYQHDAAGRLRMVQDPTGRRQWMLYDTAGRKTADIDSDGSLTEYLYDGSGRIGKTIAYDHRVSPEALTGPNITIDMLPRVRNSAKDLVTWTIYDMAGRVSKVIDGSGALTETFYDGASRVTAVTRYANRLNTALLRDPPPAVAGGLPPPLAQPAATPDPARDRTVRYFYDDDGRLTSELDPEGHRTEYEYDAAGRRTVTLQRGETTAQDIRSVTLYNGQGRIAAEIDGENHLTEFVYDTNGNLARQVRYHPALTGRVDPGTPLASIRPAPVAGTEQQVTTWEHDELNRVRRMTDAEGTVTTYDYDRMGNLLSTMRAVGTDEVRAVNARYDVLGRLTGELSGEGGALLTGNLTAAQIEDIWRQHGLKHEYDEAGRLKSTTDKRLNPAGEGLKTLYFYDADGRLERTVNPLGEVEHRRYNGLNQLESIERYGPGTADRSRTSFTYDNQGLLDSRTVAVDATTNATTSFDYDAFGGEVLRTTDLGQGARRIDRTEYDRRGLQTAVTMDEGGLGIRTTSHYDAFGRRDLFIDGNGQSHRQGFDRLGRVVQTIDGLGKARSTSYDAFDRVLTQTDALLHTTTYTYDTAQRSATVTTPENVSVTTRHTRHGQTLSITDGNLQTTTFHYDRDGHLRHTTTPLNNTQQEYDRAGRLTKTIDANGVEVTYDYDAANRLLQRRVDPTGLNLETSYEYDGLGRQFKVTDPNRVVTLTGFDLAGRVLTQTVDPGPDGLNLQTVYTHDALDNVLTVQGPGGRFTRYVYDALGRRKEEHVLADPANPMLLTKYHYDRNGNVVGRTDANGHRTQFAYDANDRMVFSVDATGGTTRHEYDDEGRLSRTTRYAKPISLAGLPVPATAADILPLALAVSSLGQDSIDARRYDKDGRLIFQVDGTGAVVEFKHDRNGNVVERIAYAHSLTQDWDGSTDPAVVRDPARDLHTRTVYDALNRARFTADALGTVVERRYDNNGNLLKSILHATQVTAEQSPDAVANDPAADRTEVFEYDKANRQTWHADAAGSVTRFDYDDNGNLERLSRFAQPLTGLEKPSSLGEPGAADRVTRYTYDHAGRRRFAVDALNHVDAWDHYDDGTLRSHTRFNEPLEEGQAPEYVRRNAALDRTEHYEYDAAGRMLMHTDAAGEREHFTYDGLGNKLSFKDKNENTWNYEYDAAGRLSRQRSPAVDVTRTTGNDTSVLAYGGIDAATRITTHLQYDGRGLLVARTEAEGRPGEQRTTRYGYDAAGRQETVTYPRVGVYDINRDTPSTGPEVARIDTDEIELQSRTVHDALGNAVATVDAAGNVSFKVHDAAGRVTGEIDALGQATQHLRNAFGEIEATIRYAVPTSLANARPDQTALADEAGAILERHAGSGVDHSLDRILRMRYDAMGRVIEVKEPQVFNYDAKANVATITMVGHAGMSGDTGIPGTTSLASKTTTSEYDAFGNLRITREEGDAGNTEPMQTTHYYDALGRRTASVDTMGYLTELGYDAAGNLTSSTEFNTAVNFGAWDWDGYQAPTVEDPLDRHTSWTYDGMNRKRTETRHDLVYSDDASGLNRTADAVTEYRYDAHGNLTQTIDALGATTTTFYDALGRFRAIAAPQRQIAVGATGAMMATPLTLFLRDALGRVVIQVESARGGATPSEYVFTSDDRVTLSRFDALDHEVQRTDAENVNHFMSYNALGLLGKSWQLVTDGANSEQTARTLYKGFAYDRLGRVEHTYYPPPYTEDQLAGTGVIDTVHEYNAFGELTKKYTFGTPEAEREYFDYDNAGRLWRTNSGDGVDKIYLHDVLGRETASIVSKGTRDLRTLSQSDAIKDPDVRITKTEYDALGRAVVQTLPEREVTQEGVTVRPEVITQRIVHSEEQKEFQEVDNVYLRWEGENEVQLNWTSLAGFGAGDIKVQLDYLSAPSTISQSGIPASVDPVPLSLTRILSSDQAVAGTTLNWKNNAGISEVQRLKIWKQDILGEWRLLSDQTTFGPSGNTITVDLPENPEAITRVMIRGNATEPWRDVTSGAYNFGSRLWYDGRGLGVGSFEYEVRTTFPASSEKTVAAGTLTLTSSARLTSLAAPVFYPHAPSTLAWNGPGRVLNYRRLNSDDVWTSLPTVSTGYDRFGVDTSSLPSGEYEYELLWMSNGQPSAHATGTFAVTTGPHISFTDLPYITDIQLDGPTYVKWKYPYTHAEFAEFEFPGIPMSERIVFTDGSSGANIPSNLARPGKYEFKISHYIPEPSTPGTKRDILVTLGTGVITMPLSGPPTLTITTPQKIVDVRLESDGRVSWPSNPDTSLTPIFEVNGNNQWDWSAREVADANGRSSANFSGIGTNLGLGYSNGPQFRIRYVNADGLTVALGSGGKSQTAVGYSSTSTTDSHPYALSLTGDGGQYVLYQDFTLDGYTGLQQPHIEQTFDRWGNVLSTTDPRKAEWKTEFAWNQNNQLVHQRRPNSDGGNTGGPVTEIYYDKLGRQLAVRDANNHANGAKDPINGVKYDAAGQVISEIHADGGYVTHRYDIFGRRVQTTDAQGNFDADEELKLGDETEGDVQATHLARAAQIREAHTRVFTYDKLDRLKSLNHGQAYVYSVSSDVNGTEVLNGGDPAAVTETFTYDEAGRKLSHVNGNGEVTQYRYDLAGHVVRTEQRGTLQTGEGLVTRYVYDERGHKTLEINANGERMGWTVDAFGRAHEHVDLGGARVNYTYDQAEQLVLQTSSRGQNQTFKYDSAGQLVGIAQLVAEESQQGGGVRKIVKNVSYTYDLAGNRVQERTEQDGVVAQDNYIGYDALGRMRYVFDGQAHLTLDYDLNGNRTVVKSSVRVLKQDSQSEDELRTSDRYFTYDAMNRQELVDGVEGFVAGAQSHVVKYDLNGNRISDTYIGNRVKIVEFQQPHFNGEGDQLFTTTQYTYDVQKGVEITEHYRYDALNRLQSVVRDNVQVDYRQYDGAGRVVRSGTPDGLPPGYVAEINKDRDLDDAIGLEKRVNQYDAYGRLKYQNTFNGNEGNLRKQGVEYINVDKVGNVLEYKLHSVDDEGHTHVKTYNTVLDRFEGYVQKTASVSGGGTTTSHHDLDGNLGKIEDSVTPANNRSFITDAQGRVLLARQGDHVQRELIVNGESLGNFGVGPDTLNPLDPFHQPQFAPRADFSFGYQPISGNYPGPAPGVYTVRQGDSLQSIARQAYGDSKLWYRIAEANGLSGDHDLRVGQNLAIPAGVGTIHNDFETFQPYDPSRIVGDTTPSLPYFRNECRALSTVIAIVVTIVVTYYSGNGAYGAMAGDAAGQVSAAMLNGRFDWKDFAERTAKGGALDIAVGPGTGGYYMGKDPEHPPGFTEVEYDYKSTAIAGAAGWAGSAAGAAAGGGAGAAAGSAGSLSAQLAQRVVSNLVGQGLNMAMGRQASFNWKSFVGAATGVPTSAQDILGMVASNVTGYALNGGFSGGQQQTRGEGPGLTLSQDAVDSWGPQYASGGSALGPDYSLGAGGVRLGRGSVDHTSAVDLQDFRQSERDYRSITEDSAAGSAYRARAGDSISSIVGSSRPQAIGNFMRANGLLSDRVDAGRNYFMPDSSTAYGDSTALGQFALAQGNQRIAVLAARAQAASDPMMRGSNLSFDGDGHSFSSMSANTALIFEDNLAVGIGRGGRIEANLAFAGPGAQPVPMAAPASTTSNFFGYTKAEMLGASHRAAVWGVHRGGTLGTATLWGSSTAGAVIDVMYPGSLTEASLSVAGGALISKTAPLAVSHLNTLPVFGSDVGLGLRGVGHWIAPKFGGAIDDAASVSAGGTAGPPGPWWQTLNPQSQSFMVQTGSNTCGPACGAQLAKQLGFEGVTQESLIGMLGSENTVASNLARGLTQSTGRRFMGGSIPDNPATLSDQALSGYVNNLTQGGSRPFMALFERQSNLGDGHWVLVDGFNEAGRLRIVDPAGLTYEQTLAGFKKAWQYGNIVY
jgi:YD repeat-containing protein